MRRFVLRCGAGPARTGQRRGKIIGEDENDAWHHMQGAPEYAKHYNKRFNERGYHNPDEHTAFEMDADNRTMFESVEETHGTRQHRDEFEKMTSDGLPKYTKREPNRDLRSSYLPKIGTPIIKVDNERANSVIGWKDDGWEQKRAGYAPMKSNKRSTYALYRSFWRLLFKFPREVQPKLSTTLRLAFKARTQKFPSQEIANAHVKQGHLILLRYIDLLARFERNRLTHDPVKRFMDVHAELVEKQIEQLDFYPYTQNTDEVKPVRDIGFHKVYRKWTMPVNVPVKVGNTALGRNVRRHGTYYRSLPHPKKKPIRYWHGPARFSLTHHESVKRATKKVQHHKIHRNEDIHWDSYLGG